MIFLFVSLCHLFFHRFSFFRASIVFMSPSNCNSQKRSGTSLQHRLHGPHPKLPDLRLHWSMFAFHLPFLKRLRASHVLTRVILKRQERNNLVCNNKTKIWQVHKSTARGLLGGTENKERKKHPKKSNTKFFFLPPLAPLHNSSCLHFSHIAKRKHSPNTKNFGG